MIVFATQMRDEEGCPVLWTEDMGIGLLAKTVNQGV